MSQEEFKYDNYDDDFDDNEAKNESQVSQTRK